jgi:hypothetical protein
LITSSSTTSFLGGVAEDGEGAAEAGENNYGSGAAGRKRDRG